jgi:hypothetical protein
LIEFQGFRPDHIIWVQTRYSESLKEDDLRTKEVPMRFTGKRYENPWSKALRPSGLSLMGALFVLLLLFLGTACDKSGAGYSLQGTSQSFTQSANSFSQNQVDILFVVDNSASMETSQSNLASNFASFIKQFQTLGFDYHIAVTGTDAYLADPFFNNAYSLYSPTNAQFKTGFVGQFGQGVSGISVLNKTNTTATVFQQNISVGTGGSGDERAFSSVLTALSDTTNVASGFRRANAFLSVIILSDEDDFSGNATYCDHFNQPLAQNWVGDHDFTAPAPILQPISYYTGLLDTAVGSHSKYSVSTLYADTAACVATLNQTDPNPARIVAQRYPAMSAATGGVTGSLCGNFATTLSTISQSVVELASVFVLNSTPNVATIVVTVAGSVVPQNATNGWQYVAATNSIAFFGTAVPAAGASINVAFTPTTISNH